VKKGPKEEYRCMTCDGHPMFTEWETFMTHITEIHKVKENAVGTKQLAIHADGPRFYSDTYQCEVGGVTFMQKLIFKRSKSSPMYE
jgi:hypothetical protein